MENRIEQNAWNFFFIVVYLVIFVAMLFALFRVNGELPRAIGLFDLVLIMLATFRLIRFFVYDKVMRWFRDIFAGSHKGPSKTCYDLLKCTWCLGLWAATFVVFFYFLIPEIAWFVILVLAIAGVASFVQLVSNLVGWSAENRKIVTEKISQEK